MRPAVWAVCLPFGTGRNGGGPYGAGRTDYLLGEKWDHPSGDRISYQPFGTSHAGSPYAGIFAGAELRLEGFYYRITFGSQPKQAGFSYD